ncbi:MAG: tetratricopeptide repeat protein [Phycisphaerales bacterium]
MLRHTPRSARFIARGQVRTLGLLIAAGLFLACAGGCASTQVEPLTSQTDPALLDPAERTLWETADRLEGQIAAYVKPAAGHEQAEQYLTEVVKKLTPDFDNPNARVRIRILPDPSPNAFVMPNGAMYVNSGLLALLENEAQIATVLGHELAHFRCRHSYREKIKEGNELVKGAIFGGALATLSSTKETANSAAELWEISSVSGYSRALESEADHMSLLAVLRAGYDPAQAVKAFEQLQTISEENDEEDPRFATHPRLSERIASYRKCLEQPEIRQQATGKLVAEDAYNGKCFDVILDNARLNLDEDNYALAQANIRRCLQLNPQSARTHYLQGELQRNGPATATDPWRFALTCFERALQYDPNCVEAYREIGLIYKELGDRDEAGDSLRKYLERAGGAPDVPLIKSYLAAVADANSPVRPLYRAPEVTDKTFREKARTVGIVPMFIPDDVIEPEKRREEFEQALTEKLKEAGFTVVPSSAYETIVKSLKRTMGGIYDPNTGELLEDRNEVVARHAFREYIKAHRIDILAYPALVTVSAKWQANRAEWHGVRESTTGKEGFWADRAAPSAFGTMPALSFRMYITSVYGELCYFGVGGIQLCSRITGGDFVDVPMHELLTDSARNARSVDIACQTLLKKAE